VGQADCWAEGVKGFRREEWGGIRIKMKIKEVFGDQPLERSICLLKALEMEGKRLFRY